MTFREIVVVMSIGVVCGIVGLVLGYVLPLILFDDATTGPLWGIFIIAPIAFIGGIVIAAILIPRRNGRIKRGLCPKCAYPVGTNQVCTECGAAVPGRRVIS